MIVWGEAGATPDRLGARMDKYASLILAAAAAWLYFTGWAYLYSYFSYFQISLMEIDPSIQFVFMHSLTPWYSLATRISFGEILLFVGIYIIIVIVIRRILASQRIYSWLAPLANGVLIGILVTITIFGVSLFVAKSAGRGKAIETWADPAMIAFFKFKDPTYGKADGMFYNLAKMNDDLALKYLASTSEMHYAFYRKPTCSDPYCGIVFKIPTQIVNEVVVIGR